ncbi:MAG: type II secretion system minor pseudopilin GspK [Burkholderiales bacterium]|nr:type II secretion system minor pseudopilin GspK [Burkholderiales bacterium]
MTLRQRGAALLAAMLTVTLVATLAAASLWQQWRSIEVESAERARLQSLWVLTGALDWARLILREDARSGGADHLAEPWAIPLEEARLSTFLSADKTTSANEEDTMLQAYLSGRISDLQARMNVRNLVDGTKLSEPALKAFARLFDQLGLAPAELAMLSDNLLLALNATASGAPGEAAPLLPQRVNQLVWLGLSPRSLEALRPYITLLPERTPVNINTASAIVLYASTPFLDLAQAQQLVSGRLVSHFRSLADAGKILGAGPAQFNEAQHSVNSRFFEVRGRLRLDQSVVEELSVVQRDGMDVKTLWREH